MQEHLRKSALGNWDRQNRLTRIAPNGACKMRVDRTCKSIMSESVLANASRAKVLRRQHASGGHDAHKRIEGRLLGVLKQSEQMIGKQKLRYIPHTHPMTPPKRLNWKRQASSPSVSTRYPVAFRSSSWAVAYAVYMSNVSMPYR